MSKLPCRKCPECGLYHDLSVVVCDACNADLGNIPALVIETDDIAPDEKGKIDENVPVFVQKCPRCGALNFTPSKEERVKLCCGCNKKRVAAVEPEEYVAEEVKSDVDETEDDISDNSIDNANTEGAKANVLFNTVDDDDDDDDDDDGGTFAFWNNMLADTQRKSGMPESVKQEKTSVEPEKKSVSYDDDDDDDDDDDVSGWSDFLSEESKPQKSNAEKIGSKITLTAINYGQLTFTLDSQTCGRYLLGRSANQSLFLEKDERVSNKHCYLYYNNNSWYVEDKHSSNGTFVNSEDIGFNGVRKLNDGDRLILGHESNSMAFRVSIE